MSSTKLVAMYNVYTCVWLFCAVTELHVCLTVESLHVQRSRPSPLACPLTGAVYCRGDIRGNPTFGWHEGQ